MLLDRNNQQHFPGLTRGAINAIAGGKSPGMQEHNQAQLLAPLREVHTTNHKAHDGFKLGDRARLL